MPADDPIGVVVAGMHRSSTSLVTAVFANNGFWLSPDQLEAKPDNPKGYFEDADMHQFHRQLLEHYDTAWDLSPRLRQLRDQRLQIPDSLQSDAEALVAKYRQHRRWVWKNPRATLFLEEWAERFPEAVFVLCVRSPGAVVDSMLRRQDRMRISNRRRFARTRRFFRALSIWRTYNLMALRFAKSHGDRCVVVRIPHDIALLNDADADAVFDPSLLRAPRRQVGLPALFALRCQWLHWQLARRSNVHHALELIAATRPADEGSIRLTHLVAVGAGLVSSMAAQVAMSVAC